MERAAPERRGHGSPRHFLLCGHSKAHFSYYATTVAALMRRGHRVDILYDQNKSGVGLGKSLRDFAARHPDLTVGTLLRRRPVVRYPIMWLRELRAIASYLSRPNQSRYYVNRATRYLPPGSRWLIGVPLVRRLLSARRTRSLLARTESLIPVNGAISRQIATHRPDVVICSPANMHASFELEYLKAARALGIPTVVPVQTWDNLSTKGLIHVAPDLLLAWNRLQAAEAEQIHSIAPQRVVITGAPFFDKWFSPETSVPIERRVLLNKIGLDPGRPYILYLGSSGNIAEDEAWLIRDILSAFRAADDARARSMQVLIRPHPANRDVYDKIVGPGVEIWPRKKELPEDIESQREFVSCVRNSVLCVGINTSAMIDAVIHGHPVATLILDQYKSTQSETAHFRHMQGAGCLYELERVDQLVDLSLRLQSGESEAMEQRRSAFVADLIRPYGSTVPAGELAAWCMEHLAEGMSAEQIRASLPTFIKAAHWGVSSK